MIQLPAIQIAAILFSIIYILFAVNEKQICFLFGGIGCSLWAYEDFVNLNLIFDGFLQLFYVGMSIYGWLVWSKRDQLKDESPIRNMTWQKHLITIATALIISIALAKVSTLFFETNLPYLDAITTSFAIVATYLLAEKYIDNWVYWMVINPIYVYIYYRTGAWFFLGMMILYTIMSIWGFIQWRKLQKDQLHLLSNLAQK